MKLLRSVLVLSCASGAAAAQLTGVAPLPGDAQVAPLYGAQQEMRIAPGAGGYLAVWADERTALEPTVELDPWEVVASDVYGVLLDASGQPVSNPIRIDASPFSQVDPNVAWTGTHWLVSYESRAMSSTTFFTSSQVHAVRVSPAGQVLDAEPLVIESGDDDSWANTVVGDGAGNGWVLWTDTRTIFARRVDAAGAVGPQKIAYTNTNWLFDMDAAFNGERFLLTWEGTGIRGRLLDAGMDPLSGAFAIGGGEDPDVATDGADFCVSWGNLGTWATVAATVVTANGAVVTPGGLAIDGLSFLALEPPQLAWDGTSYVAVWNEWYFQFPSGSIETGRFNRISAAGALMLGTPGTFFAPPVGDSVRQPVAASLAQGDALIGWIDDRHPTTGAQDGYGRILDSSDALAPDHALTVGPVQQLFPAIARGPAGASPQDDVHLLAFVSADSAETRVAIQRVAGDGAVIDAQPITLAAGATFRTPDVAWNGSEWLVVWEDTAGGTGNGGVLGMRVAADGTALDAAPIALIDGNFPAVGASGSRFFVVASKLTSGDVRTLYGKRVDASGAVLDGSPIFVGVDFAVAPTVAGFDDRWIVAWHHRPTHDTPASDIRMRIVFADGTKTSETSPTSASGDELTPDLIVDGDVATLVWSDQQRPRYVRVAKDGSLLGPAAGLVLDGAAVDAIAPTVAFDGSKEVVAWVDDRNHGPFEPGIGDVFGVRVASGGTIVGAATALAADPEAPEGKVALAGGKGVTLAAYPAMIEAFGGWRVMLGAWRDFEPLGLGLAGSLGEPSLAPSGLLLAGETIALDVAGGPPGTVGGHLAGSTAAFAPLLGGTLVPTPQIAIPIVLDGAGASSIFGVVGAPLPTGAQLFVQTWLFDPSAPSLAAATQGFVATAP